MATIPEFFVKQLSLNGNTYELISKYLQDSDGNAKDWQDIVNLVSGNFQFIISTNAANTPEGVSWFNAEGTEITGTLKAADVENPAIYFVPTDLRVSQDHAEYISVGGAWEKIGHTDIDLSQYAKKGIYTGTAAENGKHTHTVTGSVTVPTITSTAKKLGINGNAISGASASKSKMVVSQVVPAVANGTASKVTVGTNTGAASKATAGTAKDVAKAGTAVTFNAAGAATSVATVGEEQSIIPAVANGTVVPAVAVAEADRPTKTVFGTATSASKVSVTNGSVASYKQGADSFTANGDDTFTQGSQAAWSAAVSTAGVLSFNFTTNTLPTFTQGAKASFTQGTDTFTPNTPTAVSADDVVVPVVTSNNAVSVATVGTAVSVAKAGTAVKFNAAGAAVDVATVGAETSIVPAVANGSLTPYTFEDVDIPTVSASDVNVATVGTAVNVATGALSATGTGAEVAIDVDTTAAALSLVAGATGDVDVVESIDVGSTTAALANGSAAEAGEHTHTVSTTL